MYIKVSSAKQLVYSLSSLSLVCIRRFQAFFKMSFRESETPLSKPHSKTIEQTNFSDIDFGSKPISVWLAFSFLGFIIFFMLGVAFYLVWWRLSHRQAVVPFSASQTEMVGMQAEEEHVGEHAA